MYTDSVEDGEKLIQSALDEFGRIGEYCVTIFWFMLTSSIIIFTLIIN